MGTVTPAPLPVSDGSAPAGGHESAFFPLGFMGPADEALFPQIAAAGFNVVHVFASAQEVGEAEEYLDRAQATGLKVIQNMPSCRAFKSENPTCREWNVQVWSEAEWGRFISTLATHDNLVAWFLPDEIADYGAACRLYEWVKRYDPRQRPVYANPGTFELKKVARLAACADMLWAACYPEYYREPRAIVTFGMRLDAEAGRQTNARWGAILQYFDSARFGRESGYPTARELRADSYQAIIGGAKGLWYFNYEMGRDLPGLYEALTTIADEIFGSGGLDEVILSPAMPQTISVSVVSGPGHSPRVQGQAYEAIQVLEKSHNGIYLLAVNIAGGAVVARFSNLPAGASMVEVLFEKRSIPVSAGSFQDRFAQDDVHIYHIAARA